MPLAVQPALQGHAVGKPLQLARAAQLAVHESGPPARLQRARTAARARAAAAAAIRTPQRQARCLLLAAAGRGRLLEWLLGLLRARCPRLPRHGRGPGGGRISKVSSCHGIRRNHCHVLQHSRRQREQLRL